MPKVLLPSAFSANFLYTTVYRTNLLTTSISFVPNYSPTGTGRTRSHEDIQTLLEADLALTAKCLLRNPKDYSIWEHRKWILKTMPDPDWGYEFKMVQGLLERDARNCKARLPFHAGLLGIQIVLVAYIADVCLYALQTMDGTIEDTS